jgi:hypothetical protein
MLPAGGQNPADRDEKPYIPDVATNEGFKKRLEKLTSGDQYRLDPTRATVKEDATLNRRAESTMLTKFDHAELKALPASAFPSATPRAPMLASLEVIQQLEYKATEKKFEENTFTNIDFGRDAVPETLEEAEAMFMGKWQEQDHPAERERLHRLQVQREKQEYAEAFQSLERERAAKAPKPTDLFPTDLPAPAPPALGEILPNTIKLVRKKKRAVAEEPAAKKSKTPGVESSAPTRSGLVEY